MVNVNVKVGSKGQIVIPKVFRDEYGIVPGLSLVVADKDSELTIRKSSTDFVRVFEEIARSGKSIRMKPHQAYEEELEERRRRVLRGR